MIPATIVSERLSEKCKELEAIIDKEIEKMPKGATAVKIYSEKFNNLTLSLRKAIIGLYETGGWNITFVAPQGLSYNQCDACFMLSTNP